MDQIMEKLRAIPRQYYLPLAVGCIGTILFGYGLIVLLGNNQPQEKFELSQSSKSNKSQNSATTSENKIKIDVEGAVVRPGVYSIAQNGRVQDALVASGGLAASADRVWVAQHINLAGKLGDGMKVYIPQAGEVLTTSGGGMSTGTDVLGSSTSQIDINSATSDQLDSLPGVGPVTAQKIISNRPYSSVDDLVNKKVVTQKVFDKIKDQIVAN